MAYHESLTEKLGMRVAGGTSCLPGSSVQYRSAQRAPRSAAVCFLICRMAREGLLGGLSAGGTWRGKPHSAAAAGRGLQRPRGREIGTSPGHGTHPSDTLCTRGDPAPAVPGWVPASRLPKRV